MPEKVSIESATMIMEREKGATEMTFTIIEIYSFTTNRYTLDIEDLGDLFALGHDRFGDTPMTIDWATLTITVKFG